MSIVASSATRAADQTAAHVNDRIRRQAHASVIYHAQHQERIDERLRELDREWNVERWLQLNSAALSIIGLTLAARHSRWWLLLPAAVQTFFLQHALNGWCPPLPAFRRLGVRTMAEIESERHALLALRGELRPAVAGDGSSLTGAEL
jgi:hypothetical protein